LLPKTQYFKLNNQKQKEMNNQKDQILKALTKKHIKTINTDKLNTVNGGGDGSENRIGGCIVTIDSGRKP